MPLQDRKHWAAKSLAKRDELKDLLETIADWVLGHRAQTAWGLLGAAALAMAGGAARGGRAEAAPRRGTRVVGGGGGAAARGMPRLLQGDLRFPAGEYDQALAEYDKAAAEAPEALKPFASIDKILTLEAAGRP